MQSEQFVLSDLTSLYRQGRQAEAGYCIGLTLVHSLDQSPCKHIFVLLILIHICYNVLRTLRIERHGNNQEIYGNIVYLLVVNHNFRHYNMKLIMSVCPCLINSRCSMSEGGDHHA